MISCMLFGACKCIERPHLNKLGVTGRRFGAHKHAICTPKSLRGLPHGAERGAAVVVAPHLRAHGRRRVQVLALGHTILRQPVVREPVLGKELPVGVFVLVRLRVHLAQIHLLGPFCAGGNALVGAQHQGVEGAVSDWQVHVGSINAGTTCLGDVHELEALCVRAPGDIHLHLQQVHGHVIIALGRADQRGQRQLGNRHHGRVAV
mmetsp:Transcript_107025/g.255502  ORF Transcript_107025/g.255502 Transcript_107025/m.255502 type:complete len:205 (+) Transcript_107025:357-971(+)